MAGPKQRRFTWDWYSVSVDAVRLSIIAALAVVALVAGFIGYGRFNQYRLQQKASEWVAKPEGLLTQLRIEHPGSAFRAELDLAEERLDEARTAQRRGAYRSAISHGQASFRLLQGVLDAARLGGTIAWFLSVQGDVEYRRGESGPFLQAYPRSELREGDYVRSGKGASAEIHFRDEETVFRLRPGSMIKLTGAEKRTDTSDRTLGFMEYGWVSLDTAETPSALETPYSHLRADQHSLVSIELDEGSDQSRIRVSEGGAEIRDLRSGTTRRLAEREEVQQSKAGFTATVRLPPHPLLASPPDGYSINIDTTNQVRLSWNPVPGAARYALQVSKSRLFGENIIDAGDRQGTAATLGLREEGNYMWRVAAYDGRGALGPWSETRKFRVASYRDLALEDDRQPPVIDVDILLNGNIAVIVGHTEPGSQLWINGTEALVSADGTFNATRTLWSSGRQAIQFVALDRAGNRTSEQRWVYVEF